jgi:hypothetical protein
MISPLRHRAPGPIELSVRAFWSENEQGSLDLDEQAALASLVRWLDDDTTPFALLHGPRMGRRAVMAAQLIRDRQGSAGREVHLVPIGPDLRLERDIIALLVSRLQEDPGGGSVRNFIQRVAWESLGPGRENRPPLLLALTDVDEADPNVDWQALFSGIGPRIKVLATVEGGADTIHTWLERLGFDSARTFVYALPPHPDPLWESLAACLATKDQAPARLLGMLSCALGRLSTEELALAFGAPCELALVDLAPFVTEVEGTYAIRRGSLRREVESHLSLAERLAWVERLLSLSESYGCDYLRAHLEQCDAPLDGFDQLVTPEYLTRWLRRPCHVLGFFADLERVRQRAAETLSQRTAPEAIALASRAALLEASVGSRAGYEEDGPPPAVGVMHIALQDPIADHRDQARAFVVLGKAMAPGAMRAEVLSWALGSARRIEDADFRGDTLVSLAKTSEGEARLALAHEAVTAYRASDEPACSLLVAVEILPPDEGLTLAREAIAMLQKAGKDPEDVAGFVKAFPRPVAEALWSDANNFPWPARTRVLAALSANLGDPDRASFAFEAFCVDEKAYTDEWDVGAHRTLAYLVPQLDRTRCLRAVTVAIDLGDLGVDVRVELAVRLASFGEPIDTLLATLPEDRRPGVLARTLPFSPDPKKRREHFLAMYRAALPNDRFRLILSIGPALAEAGHTDELLALLQPEGDRALFSALTVLAEHDPARAPDLARRALALGLRFTQDDAYRLLYLLPLVSHLPRAGVAHILTRLLDEVASNVRSAALAGERVSIIHLIPLFAALEGDLGLHEVAREIIRVVTWFP